MIGRLAEKLKAGGARSRTWPPKVRARSVDIDGQPPPHVGIPPAGMKPHNITPASTKLHSLPPALPPVQNGTASLLLSNAQPET